MTEPGGRPPAIRVRKLTKAFGHHAALRGVDLELAEGEFLARPSSGTVHICGQDLDKEATAVRRQIGLISHHPLLYGDLTADENLHFFARMYDLPDAATRINAVLEQVGLISRRRDPVRTYSRGMVQRLTIARAVLHDPDGHPHHPQPGAGPGDVRPGRRPEPGQARLARPAW